VWRRDAAALNKPVTAQVIFGPRRIAAGPPPCRLPRSSAASRTCDCAVRTRICRRRCSPMVILKKVGCCPSCRCGLLYARISPPPISGIKCLPMCNRTARRKILMSILTGNALRRGRWRVYNSGRRDRKNLHESHQLQFLDNDAAKQPGLGGSRQQYTDRELFYSNAIYDF
jgi:hypothetical protein